MNYCGHLTCVITEMLIKIYRKGSEIVKIKLVFE